MAPTENPEEAEKEIVGKHFSVFFTAEDQANQKPEAELRAALLYGRAEDDGCRVRKDGTTFMACVVATALYDEHGTHKGFAKIVRDTTEREEAHRIIREKDIQLQQAQKMEAIGRLAGGVAHDFNNMMTAVCGYSELLLAKLHPSDPMRREIEDIRKAGGKAADITKQLLAFSRKQMLQPKVLDPNAVVADMDKLLRRLIGEDIDLVTTLDPQVPHIKVDPGQLEQVIVNLSVNARDAMPEGGKLTIETKGVVLDAEYAQHHAEVMPGPYVMIAVTDTGTGMDNQTLHRLFEPFFTTKAVGKGTGLGLSVVHGIVKQSGGHIWVYSEPGKGTTFKVYFPAVEEALSVTTAEFRLPGEALRGSETILLVEDEQVVRDLASMVLEGYGYNLLAASDPDEAVLLATRFKGKIHLLLTDVVLPQCSGRVLRERLATTRPDMKVIYMSGYTENAVVHRGVVDAGTAFVQKPFSTAALAKKVRDVLDGMIS